MRTDIGIACHACPMGLVDRIKDLLAVAAEGNERRPGLRIVPTADQSQTDMVWGLLAEQIEHGWDESLPKPAPNPDDLYRPTLIGAWAENRLVGGAFVMPDSQDAQAFTSIGADKAAQAFERSCCMIQGIAVVPEHRREGIGLKIKRRCDLWAAQHDACIVLSIPTNDAAARMNEKAGYDVLPPQVALCVEVADDDRGIVCCLPMGGDVPGARWAFHIVAQPQWTPLAIGQCDMTGTGGRYDDHSIGWMYRADIMP